jgi:hypothetical protein
MSITVWLPWTVAIITVAIAVVLRHFFPKMEIGPILVAGGSAFAVLQWRHAIEQKAMDLYQSEIGQASAATTKAVCKMMLPQYLEEDKDDPESLECTKYVYHQLDLLEFAIERFRKGFATAYTTMRAVITFARKCEVDDFRRRAWELVESQRGSYSPVAENVARNVILFTEGKIPLP